MSLDPTQLDAVRRFLRTNMQFFTGVPLLRSKPFEFPDAPEQRGSLQDAAATKPRTGLVRGLFAFGILLTVAGSLFQYLLWRQTTLESKHHPPPAFTLDSLGQYLMGLLSASPESLAQTLFHSLPILCIALGILLLVATVVFSVMELPAHEADPLLSRLLQATLGSSVAPSNRYVQSLLANARFEKIYTRAAFTVFPADMDVFKVTDLVLQTKGADRDLSTVSPEWENFIERLLNILNGHQPFVHFVENHPGTRPEELYGQGLREQLQYGMRQLYFEEFLTDPDFVFLCSNQSDLWHKVVQWCKTADLKKVAELFPKTESSSGGTEKKSIALWLVIALLLLSLLTNLPLLKGGGGNRQEPPPPETVALKLDAHEFLEKLAELTAKLCQPCSPSPSAQPEPSSVYVSVPASPPAMINIPPLSVPSKMEVTVSNPPGAKTEIQQNVNLPPAQAENNAKSSGTQPPPGPQPPPAATRHGDTLVSFTPDQKHGHGDLSSQFVLLSPSGKICAYTATLPGTAKKWFPDPVQMAVQLNPTPPPAEDCLRPSAGEMVPVSRQPLYSDFLQAYVSLYEKHVHPIFFSGHDQVVVLIHYASPKLE